MTRYYTRTSNQLLSEIGGEHWPMPTGFRLIRQVGPTGPDFTLVEFEDDGAPADLEGCEITPTISAEYDTAGNITRTWISDRARIPLTHTARIDRVRALLADKDRRTTCYECGGGWIDPDDLRAALGES